MLRKLIAFPVAVVAALGMTALIQDSADAAPRKPTCSAQARLYPDGTWQPRKLKRNGRVMSRRWSVERYGWQPMAGGARCALQQVGAYRVPGAELFEDGTYARPSAHRCVAEALSRPGRELVGLSLTYDGRIVYDRWDMLPTGQAPAWNGTRCAVRVVEIL